MRKNATQRSPCPIGSLDVVLIGLLALLLVPCIVALRALPWTQKLAVWTLPALIATGVFIGALLVFVHLPRRWWWIPIGSAPLLGAAIAVGASIAAQGAHSQAGESVEVGTILLGSYIAGMIALLPWLVFRAAQPWLAVVFVWITVLSVWGRQFSLQQAWWIVWLLATSVVLLGLAHLRSEKRVWDTNHLEHIGPVLWPSARTILALSLLVALLGLLPLGITRLAALSNAWNHSSFGQSGPLTHQSANGVPVAMLGAPLSLNAPDVAGDQVILTYDILAGPATAAPLLGATLDTFDGTTWTGTSATTVPVPLGTFAMPAGAQLLQTRIRVVTLPRVQSGTPLLGFDQPLAFSVPAQARLITANTPSPMNVAGWQTTTPLDSGTTYTVESAILPDKPVANGALNPDLQAHMTTIPGALQPLLIATAKSWAGTASTPIAQANAVIDAMHTHLTLDPQASVTPGVDAITQFLQQKRGNVLVWTTTYILLCRALGLPVRLAEGYLPGFFDTNTHTMIVRASDAAVWAQLAVPGVGWLDLFPAGTNVSVVVPSKVIYKPAPTPTPQPKGLPTPTTALQSAHQRNPNNSLPPQSHSSSGILLIVGLLLSLLLLALAIFAMIVRLQWARYGRQLAPLPRFFARVGLLAKYAGIALRPSDTSAQATSKVVAYVPEHEGTLKALNNTYEQMRYGRPEERWALPNLHEQWQRLGKTLWRLVMTRPWRLRQHSTQLTQSRQTKKLKG